VANSVSITLGGHLKTGQWRVPGTSGFYAFSSILSTRIGSAFENRFSVFFFITISSSRGCGNCGKLERSLPGFPSAVGTVQNMQFVFHRFHSAAVSIALSPKKSLSSRRSQKVGPYFSSDEFFAAGAWSDLRCGCRSTNAGSRRRQLHFRAPAAWAKLQDVTVMKQPIEHGADRGGIAQ